MQFQHERTYGHKTRCIGRSRNRPNRAYRGEACSSTVQWDWLKSAASLVDNWRSEITCMRDGPEGASAAATTASASWLPAKATKRRAIQAQLPPCPFWGSANNRRLSSAPQRSYGAHQAACRRRAPYLRCCRDYCEAPTRRPRRVRRDLI